MYVELHARSAFSFLEGAALPEALAERAARLGQPALALLDRDGLYGAPRLYRAAIRLGVKPLGGRAGTGAGGGGLAPRGGPAPGPRPSGCRSWPPTRRASPSAATAGSWTCSRASGI